MGGMLTNLAGDVKGITSSLQKAFQEGALEDEGEGMERQVVDEHENPMRRAVLERLQGEDTSLDMGLKVGVSKSGLSLAVILEWDSTILVCALGGVVGEAALSMCVCVEAVAFGSGSVVCALTGDCVVFRQSMTRLDIFQLVSEEQLGLFGEVWVVQ